MSGAEWTGLLGGVAGILTPIGLAFWALIKMIVSSSREAVKELQITLKETQKDRDTWRDRAYSAGWRAEE